MVEAAILGKPVLSLLTEEFAATQKGTLHFHYLLPENGGFLRVASTLDEHVTQLVEALRHPDVSRAQTHAFVRSFLRPRGLRRAVHAAAGRRARACRGSTAPAGTRFARRPHASRRRLSHGRAPAPHGIWRRQRPVVAQRTRGGVEPPWAQFARHPAAGCHSPCARGAVGRPSHRRALAARPSVGSSTGY